MSEGGFVSVKALTLIIFLAAVVTGLILFMTTSFTYERKSVHESESRQALRARAREVVEVLLKSDTPKADSRMDGVWTELPVIGGDGYIIDLTDMSSRINPNGVRKTLLERTDLRSLLLPEISPGTLQQYREDEGVLPRIETSFSAYFTKEAFSEPFLTGYSYFNINVTDEFVLRKLCEVRTGDPLRAEIFHAKIQDALTEQRIITREELKDFMGNEYAELFPVINAEPEWNVHFAPEYLMGEILSYPAFEVKNPKAVLARILEYRENAELTEEDLRGIIGKEEDNRVYQYLGTITWFWLITVTEQDSDNMYSLIVARMPAAEDRDGLSYKTVEEWYGE